MKTILKSIITAAAVAGLAACSDSEYKVVPFASLDTQAVTVDESETETLVSIPVRVYNNKTGCTVSYTITDGSAVNGVNFKPLNDSGVLNFEAGTDSLAISFYTTGAPGTFTGDQTFSVKLTDASEGVTLGTFSKCTVTIKDTDHPLSALFGKYTMKAVSLNTNDGLGYYSWDMNMSPYEGDVTRVWMDNVVMFSFALNSYSGNCPVYGVVSDDRKTITIPLPQKTTGSLAVFELGDAWIYAHEGTKGGYITEGTNVVFTLNEKGEWVTPTDFGLSNPDVVDQYSVLYAYCVNFSSYNAKYPTYFTKAK